MKDIKVTVASLRSELKDPHRNLERVKQACQKARDDGARLIVLPELMLTGHGGHPKMVENAQAIPSGPLSSEVVRLSGELDLCICVGIAERDGMVVYNSQMVADRGEYLGLQRKVNMSTDEYLHFGTGEKMEVFDIGDVRFGITICYDNHFPELALVHGLHNVDLILAPHAARTGKWPEELTAEFREEKIQNQQKNWARTHQARSQDQNCYVLLCNAVGSATEGLDGDVAANHAGTVMGFEPGGEEFLRTSVDDFVDEVVTVELKADKRKVNHGPTRNRRLLTVIRMLQDCER